MSDVSTTGHWDQFMEGIWRQNPVFVMVLGMCPTLAVTVSAVNAISMGVATTFVLACSCLLVSMMRNVVPKEVRIATYIVIIATFVTAVDYIIQAIFTIGLLALGSVREVLGAGTLFGVSLFGANFQPWVIMVLPPGGFFVLGAWLLFFAWHARRKERQLREAGQHA